MPKMRKSESLALFLKKWQIWPSGRLQLNDFFIVSKVSYFNISQWKISLSLVFQLLLILQVKSSLKRQHKNWKDTLKKSSSQGNINTVPWITKLQGEGVGQQPEERVNSCAIRPKMFPEQGEFKAYFKGS